MPDATITSTASTFGTISGVFSADQSTISGTISGVVPGTLTGSVGVPGPAGPAGIGLPAGGTSGQFLQKTSGVDYATDWVTVNLTGLATESWVTAGFYPLTGNPSGFLTASALTPYLTSATAASTYQTLAGMSAYLTKADNLGSLTNFATARDNLGLGSLSSPTFAGLTLQGSGANVGQYTPTSLSLSHTTFGSFVISPSTGITFPDSSVQTTAFTTAQLTNYLAKASNLSDLTSASSARTNLGLGSLAVVNDAPSDGSQYARKNGAWDVVSAAASYISSVSSPLSVTSGNLTIDLSAYAQLSGATFTGNVFAPTPSPGTDSTRIATTEWVKDFDYAPTNSPHFTGNPKSVTPLTGDDDTSIATTAFVKAQGYLTSAPVTSVAGRTGAITLSNTDISGLGTMATATAADYSTTLAANGLYYPLSGNPDGFLNAAVADTLYYGIGNPSNYLTSYDAAFSFYPLSGNPSSFLVAADIAGKADLASPTFTGVPLSTTAAVDTNTTQIATTAFVIGQGYLKSATAASTYQTLSGMSSYLTTSAAASTYYPLTGNPSGFLTSAPVTSVAGRTGAITLSNTDISGLGTLATVNDAPSDGNQYARKNGAWDIVSVPSSYITSVSSPLSVTSGNLSVDLSAYLTSATAASTYQTISGMSSYLTTSTAASTYQTISGMSSYLTTSAAASTYLTQSNAASTYQTISGMSSYLTTSSAASTYQTQAGMSDYLSKAGNLAGLANTATARTNLGLGTMATATASDYSTTTVANGLYYPLSSNPAGYLTTAPVTSVAGRTGAVTLAVADVSGAAPLASPALTGTPTAPTATGGTNTTQIATTAFVTAAIPTNNVKAWVNFNGTGTVAIRASANVSSITDNGVGIYTLNFTNALADTNYSVISMSNLVAGASTFVGMSESGTRTTSSVQITNNYGAANARFDVTFINVAVFA
jgi:hypothetical protein